MSIKKRARLVPWIAGVALMGLVALTAIPGLAAPSAVGKQAEITVSGPDGSTTGSTSYTKSGAGKLFKFKMQNKSPGNANFNSATITTPLCAGSSPCVAPNRFVITNAAISTVSGETNNGSNSGATVTWVDGSGNVQCTKGSALSACTALPSGVTPEQGKVYVQGLSTVKSSTQAYVTVRVTMTVPSISGCNPVTATPDWDADIRAGSNLSGDQFLTSGSTTTVTNTGQTTSILGSCSIVLSQGPADGAVGTPGVGVTAQLQDGTGNVITDSTGTISIVTETSSAGSLTGGDSKSFSGGSASFTLVGNTIGTYSIHASSSDYGDSGSASFKLYEYGTCRGESETEGNATITNIDTTCALFTATFDGRTLTIDKPAGDEVLLEVKVDAFDPEPAVYPVPGSLVSPPAPAHIGKWCDGAPGTYTPPSGEAWCLQSQSTVSYGKDKTDGSAGDWVGAYPTSTSPNYAGQLMQVTEVWLLDGDAVLCRRCA